MFDRPLRIAVIASVLAVLAAPCFATVLTFDIAGITNFQAAPQGYGDNVTSSSMGSFSYGSAQGFTPNLTVSYGNTTPALWTTGYGDLTNIAFEDADGSGILNITLTSAATGVQARLHSFDLAAFTANFASDPTINSVTVYDGANAVLFAQNNVTIARTGHTSFVFDPPLIGATLRIEVNALNLGGRNDDIAADNITFSQVGSPPSGTPVSREFYWTTFGNANAYGHGSFSWDGVALSASTSQLGAVQGLTLDGSLAIGADGNIYSGRAGTVTQINPATNAQVRVSSGVNNNVTSIDPTRTTVYVGWKDTDLATLATGSAFGAGTPRNVTGDDGVATGLAWETNGTVWYTTGGENPGNFGNVGRINLSTFVTTRAIASISATTITFDPFTGHLFTAGVNGIAQIDPATNSVVSTWLNPRGAGLFIQNLEATGDGHLVAFDSGSNDALLRVWDFSNGSGLIGGPDTINASVAVPVLSGGLAFADVPGFPLITSPLNVTTRIGQQFVYVLETNGPVTGYTAGTLPPGLVFDVAPQAITGAPTQTGTFQVPLTATNAFGTTTATLTINVLPAATLAITSGTSATGRTGAPFRFQVITSGGGAGTQLSATDLPAGLRVDPGTGVISGTPVIDGNFRVSLTATDGSVSATATLQLTFSSDPTLPVIVSASEASVAPGESFSYRIVAPTSVGASDPTEFALVGNLPQGLGFDSSTGTIFGTYSGNAAQLARRGAGKPLSGGVITNVQLFATNSRGTTTLPLVFFLKPAGVVNISTRLAVQTGDNVLIGGFIITGNAPKKLLIRAIGPSLQVDGRLEDPVMELYDANGLLGTNDDWRSTQEQEIIDTTIPPNEEREAAILATLNPGAYTAVVKGNAEGTGVGLVELYDLGTASLDSSSAAQLANISTRGLVQRDDDVMIGGFIVTSSSKLIVRAIGPSLGAAGVAGALENTTLEVRDGNGDLLALNDDWRSNQEQDIIDSRVAPTDDRESAIIATFPSGNYTAVVRGASEATGVALVEGYVLD